jgi:hypothetical protein
MPQRMTPSLALWLGLLAGHGDWEEDAGRIVLPCTHEAASATFRDLAHRLFRQEIQEEVDPRAGGRIWAMHSRPLCQWLADLLLDSGGKRHVPEQIFQGSSEEQSKFLTGLGLPGNSPVSDCGRETLVYAGGFETLAREAFSLCQINGMLPYLYTREDKASALLRHELIAALPRPARLPGVPFLPDSMGSRGGNSLVLGWGTPACSWPGTEAEDLHYLRVTGIQAGENEVYDIEVAGSHDYLVDGIVSHNTINVPTDFPYEDFKGIYMYAYEKRLKGCTTFRFNPEAFQGVLVKDQDLENTIYCFTLEDGSKIEVRGNEEIEYDGEIHTAANLYDAIKEGYYGKF